MAITDKVILVIRSSRPRFRNNHDKIAFVVHATSVAYGYKLLATGRPVFAVNALELTPIHQREVEIEGWNESDKEYAFIYADPKQGWRKVMVMCLVIGDKLFVDGVAEGGTQHAHLLVKVEKYVAETREEGSDYDGEFKNLGKLVTLLVKEILSKLGGDGGSRPVACTTTGASPKRNEEPEPEPLYYPSRPFPLFPQFHPPSQLVNRPDYSDLLPRPPAGVFPAARDGFGGGSMPVRQHDLAMLNRFVEQVQPGFMGSPQPILQPPGARYDPIGTGFEPGRYGSLDLDRQPQRSREDIHPQFEHFM